MGQIHLHHISEDRAFGAFASFMAEQHPHLRFGRATVDGETVLMPEHGGIKVFWLYAGEGEVFLPAGYRTKEGDGQPLPPEYRADGIEEGFAAALDYLKGCMASICAPAQAAVHSIISRRRCDNGSSWYVGDMAHDLWRLEHSPRPWSFDVDVINCINYLFSTYRNYGYSEKLSNSYEPVMQGDQLVVDGTASLRVRGRFSCLTLENVERVDSHVPGVMRLRYLKDTAGGCNFDFDPFRRLPLTWYMNVPDEAGDGLNFVNSHVVNIPRETSPSHFHPVNPTRGGVPQDEMYLVLDPAAYRLNTYGREASIIFYPDLHDLRRFDRRALRQGTVVYIPAGTGHRGIDAFTNVITIPGFKPHNEFYLDRDLADAGVEDGIANHNLLHLKNYGDLAELI